MLKRYSEIFRTVLLVTDLSLVAGSWLAAYWIRFSTAFDSPLGVPPLGPYLMLLAFIAPLWLWLFRSYGLYEPRRTSESALPEVGSVLTATTLGTLAVIAVTFFLRTYFYSRSVVALFYGLAFLSVAACRMTIRAGLRWLRRRDYNLRYALVAGAGQVAEEVVERIHSHPEAGLRVVGILTDDVAVRRVRGVPRLGAYAQIKEVLGRHPVDQVLLALPRDESDCLEKLLADLEDELASVRLVPDLLHVLTLQSSVEDLEGLPVIRIRESPLLGWAAIQKRVFDVSLASAALLLLSPLLLAIAVAIRVSSGRPVLYAQERTGLDGRAFPMLKFRTMVLDAEQETGPVWAKPGDRRRTRLGTFLRGASLDELPQLWNVVRGDMSLVGPRPERPIFIEQFRRDIPGYMLRHKVKAGLTGWAQIHGWRGDTSLHERVEHDIYYIQNWSLGLDVRILLMTLWRGLMSRNAY
jgi:Undecaprenyl-phosphate glucose phosphotransferase